MATLAQIHKIKIDFNRYKIMFYINNYKEAIIRESSEIIFNKEKVYNSILSYKNHAVWKELINNK